MNDRTPYVVDNRWIVYARGTMDATMKYRAECDPTEWPTVRQATPADLTRLPDLTPTSYRNAA